MAEPNGNGRRGGALVGLSEKIVRALPPAFLVLTLLNIGFIGMAMYVLQHNTSARNEMLNKILTSCLDQRDR